jgi:hypothetical protein
MDCNKVNHFFSCTSQKFDSVRENLTQLIRGDVTIGSLEEIRDTLITMKSELDAVIEEGTPTDEAWILEGNIDNLLDEVFARINSLSK